jgi:hypothetical protein
MIHQFVLAAPRPGMSVEEFQSYWLHVHAVKFAGLVPQYERYLVDTRIPFDDAGSPRLPHEGIAEIWLTDERQQLAALGSDELLHGVLPDEPNWTAFWLTIVLDTTAHELVAGPAQSERQPAWVKQTTLLKRRPGMSLVDHRRATLESYAPVVSGLPGLRRHLHCHTRDAAYVFGEPRFDSVEQLWFDDVAALRAALTSAHHVERVRPVLSAVADPQYVFALTAKENWIIGPD